MKLLFVFILTTLIDNIVGSIDWGLYLELDHTKEYAYMTSKLCNEVFIYSKITEEILFYKDSILKQKILHINQINIPGTNDSEIFNEEDSKIYCRNLKI